MYPSTARAAVLEVLAAVTAVLAMLAGLPAGAAGPRQELFEVSAKEMIPAHRLFLPTVWKYTADDDPVFADRNFDDSAWAELDTRLRPGDAPEDWSGLGWFRLRFRVDPELQGMAMGLLLDQLGAAEVYLDGVLLYQLGTVHPDPSQAIGSVQRQPHVFAFDTRPTHVLAVRYSHHPASGGGPEALVGFRATLGEANQHLSVFSDELRTTTSYQALFTGIFASFAVLHFLLFVFYREAAENLWFALLTSCVALVVYFSLQTFSTTDPAFLRSFESTANALWLALSVCALGFVYRVFDERHWRLFYAVAGAAAVLLVPGILWPAEWRRWIAALVVFTFLEMCRAVVKALRRHQPGARIVGLGILVVVAGFAVGLLSGLEILPTTLEVLFLVPLYSMSFLILSMSVHLSRNFARANRDLRAQLLQVRQLSEQKLDQERRAREDEVHRTRLQAEYQRKARELEEARQLQLSMLPERLPDLPDLEIAADMRTATEVGGDYYDFDMADDGTLTIAIGDATGHGMRAGTMVTATKSLFHSLGAEPDLPETLGRFTRAIKRMNLRQLSMALTLVRFKDGRLSLAAAGMPPALVYRAGSKTVETLLVEGAPLGSLTGYPYRQVDIRLDPGDAVLLMSDGFPERLNHEDEMLGYDKATEVFGQAAVASPRGIIRRLVEAGDDWAAGQPPRDDMTFVVMKRRV